MLSVTDSLPETALLSSAEDSCQTQAFPKPPTLIQAPEQNQKLGKIMVGFRHWQCETFDEGIPPDLNGVSFTHHEDSEF